MLFINRKDAAEQLFPWLEKYKQDDGILLAIPRGGVVIGHVLAKKFHFPMELLFTKKIGHPLSSELAIGAVSLHDHILDPQFESMNSYAQLQVPMIRKKLIAKNQLLLGENYKPADLKHKTVILVDDGVATGNTLLAGIKFARMAQPAKIIIATPVSSSDAAVKIRREADAFICLHTASDFYGVSQFYNDFSEISDKEVSRLLDDLKNPEFYED
jgi:putative phosphoribosyl transferase